MCGRGDRANSSDTSLDLWKGWLPGLCMPGQAALAGPSQPALVRVVLEGSQRRGGAGCSLFKLTRKFRSRAEGTSPLIIMKKNAKLMDLINPSLQAAWSQGSKMQALVLLGPEHLRRPASEKPPR